MLSWLVSLTWEKPQRKSAHVSYHTESRARHKFYFLWGFSQVFDAKSWSLRIMLEIFRNFSRTKEADFIKTTCFSMILFYQGWEILNLCLQFLIFQHSVLLTIHKLHPRIRTNSDVSEHVWPCLTCTTFIQPWVENRAKFESKSL